MTVILRGTGKSEGLRKKTMNFTLPHLNKREVVKIYIAACVSVHTHVYTSVKYMLLMS